MKAGNQLLPPPGDLVLVTKMRRDFIDPHNGTERIAKEPSNVYFHCHPDCVKRKQPHFVACFAHVDPEVTPYLTDVHTDYIYKNFNIRCF
jgi:uncharacterized FlgJ-related protein